MHGGTSAKFALGGCKICTGGSAISARGVVQNLHPIIIYIIKYIIIYNNKGAEALWGGEKEVKK